MTGPIEARTDGEPGITPSEAFWKTGLARTVDLIIGEPERIKLPARNMTEKIFGPQRTLVRVGPRKGAHLADPLRPEVVPDAVAPTDFPLRVPKEERKR